MGRHPGRKRSTDRGGPWEHMRNPAIPSHTAGAEEGAAGSRLDRTQTRVVPERLPVTKGHDPTCI